MLSYALAFISRQLRLERVRDVQCDIRLDRENVRELAIVRLCPYLPSGFRIDELRDDAHAVAGVTNAAVEHGRGAERRPDLLETLLSLLERHHGCARDDAQRADLGQMRDDVLGDAIGEVLLVRVRAQ